MASPTDSWAVPALTISSCAQLKRSSTWWTWMNVQQAIEAPRWSTRSFPASPFPHTMYPGDLGVESRIGEKVQQALIAKGHKLRVSGPWSMSEMAVIVIDPKTGVLHAGAAPRNDAYAWAW